NISLVAANGTPSLTYQWQYNNAGTWGNVANGTPAGSTYSGGTSATTFNVTHTTAGSYQYRCIVSASGSGCGAATSSTVTVTVVADPSVTTQPVGTTICAGQSYVISTSINNGTGLGYQWQYWNGSAWASVAANQPAAGFTYTAPTTASMTISTTAATPNSSTYQFRCVVTSGNGCNPNPLNTSGVTVNVVPAIINAGYRTWTGMIDTDWDKPLNWDCGGVPISTTDVWIPATTSTGFYPVIVSGQVADCNSIRVEGGATRVTIDGTGILNIHCPAIPPATCP
ncbi:MAG: hypothetical protein K9J06_10640, partial [Flavobacteriales bacterium]|nr:hypothetical protein [Flavobacteriales bacterium]